MRARNMQELTDEIKEDHPGVVIGGVGDAAHKLRSSDHNEDDTAGSKAAQTDADSKPEHRAIDVMLGSAFSKADAYELIDNLVGDPADRARLKYIIFNGSIWSRSNGWKKADFDGDPHTDHVHLTGDAADDDNDHTWLEDDMGDLDYGSTGWKKANEKAIGTRPARLLLDELWMEVHGGFDGAYDTTASPRGGLLPRLDRIETVLEELKATPPQPAPVVTDEQLERVLRKVLGGVDGATPAG